MITGTGLLHSIASMQYNYFKNSLILHEENTKEMNV
jgi:hypothetical protein